MIFIDVGQTDHNDSACDHCQWTVINRFVSIGTKNLSYFVVPFWNKQVVEVPITNV